MVIIKSNKAGINNAFGGFSNKLRYLIINTNNAGIVGDNNVILIPRDING